MGEWQSRARFDQLGDTPPEGIPAVRDQLWSPVRVSAETYSEPPSAPPGRWAGVLAAVRYRARLFVIVAIYLCAVTGLSLIVSRAVSTLTTATSAAGTGHQAEQFGLGPLRSAPYNQSAQHKPPAIQPSPVFPPPKLTWLVPSAVSSPPGTSPHSLSPSPAPTPAPSPTSPPPTSPPPTSPPPTSPPPTSPPPTASTS
jgi:hypothetical protein